VLTGQLRDSVGRDRGRDRVLPRGVGEGVAVDGRRGREHDAEASLHGAVGDHVRCQHVVVHVGLEARAPACAHARPGGQVEDPLDPLQRLLWGRARGQIVLQELEPRVRPGGGDRRLLSVARVVVGERVDPRDLAAVGEQRLDQGRADEAGAAGDQIPRHRPEP
jgi:hypothetical protein